jgi:WD40 repeat protein
MPDIYNMSDVFISYSRKDNVFARKLFDSLKAKGKEVWADFEDIPKAADWWQEIQAGINAADTFIFIISPDSVRSDVCRQEVDHAIANNKRLLPLLYREILEADDKTKIHAAISAHNWIFCREADSFDDSFAILMEAIETDLDHNRTLTRLLVRAREWNDKNRSTSYLLRGDDLSKAEQWLTAAVNKKPAPTTLHMEYISASRQAQVSEQRRRMTLMSVGFAISLVLTIFALVMWNNANIARDDAEQARADAEVARDDARVAEKKARSLGLASSANEALVNHNPDLALALALQAANIDRSQPQILSSLGEAVYSPGTSKVIPVGAEAIISVTYSPNGEQIATGTTAGKVCVWDEATGEQVICSAEAHGDDVVELAFTPAGNLLVSASLDGTARVWDMNPDTSSYGKELRRFTCEQVNPDKACGITSMAMSQDGQVALFGTNDGNIAMWNPVSGTLIRYMDKSVAAGSPIKALAISASGLRALAGLNDGRLVHWYLTKGKALGVMPERATTPITSVAFNPGGQFGVTGDDNGLITLWDLESNLALRTFSGHEETVTSIEFIPETNIFFSTSWDNTIMEWDADNGRVIRDFHGHDGGVNAISVHPDGDFIASGGFDIQVRTWQVWSFLTKKRLLVGEGQVQGIAYLPGKGYYAAAQTDGDVFLFDSATDTRVHTFRGYGEDANDVAISPDGHYLAAVFFNNRLMMREIDTGKRMWAIDLTDVTRETPFTLAFSPDSRFILVGFYDGWAWYDTVTGEKLGNIGYEWDLPVGQQPEIRSFAIHPGGEMLLIGLNSITGNLRLVELETGELIRTFEGHRDGVLAVDFNRNGTQAISGSFDNDVRLWDVETGRKIRSFSGHSDRVTSVAFSPNETLLVSGSNDRSVRLWNINVGFELYRYIGHTDRVTEVRFSEDGLSIMSSGRDGDLFIWRLPQPLDEMIAWALENRYVRPLTCNERLLYVSQTELCDD